MSRIFYAEPVYSANGVIPEDIQRRLRATVTRRVYGDHPVGQVRDEVTYDTRLGVFVHTAWLEVL